MKRTAIYLFIYVLTQGFCPEIAAGQLTNRSLGAHKQTYNIDSDSTLLSKMSELLTIIGDYPSAAAYQRRIVQQFKGKEIQNQAGAVFVLAAMEYIDPQQQPYILPMEFDAKTRLSNTQSPLSDTLNMRDSLLQDAVVQFEQAIKSDKNFLPAYLNMGAALALLEMYDQANFWVQKGIEHCSTQKMTADFLAMEGIIAALRGDKLLAIQQLHKAQTIGSYLATQNLTILEKIVLPTMKMDGPPTVNGVEQIEWFSLPDYLASPAVDKEIVLSPQWRCGMKQKTLSQLYLHVFDGENQTVVFQETNSKYTASTLRAIIPASSADNIQEAYGVPERIVRLPNVLVWVYPKEHIYFRFDYRRVLLNWGVYLASSN